MKTVKVICDVPYCGQEAPDQLEVTFTNALGESRKLIGSHIEIDGMASRQLDLCKEHHSKLVAYLLSGAR